MIGGMELVVIIVMAVCFIRADEMASILRSFKQMYNKYMRTKSEITDAVVTPIKDAFREGFKDQ